MTSLPQVSSMLIRTSYVFQQIDECILMYELESNLDQIHQLSFWIRIDSLLRVELFYKNSTISLPTSFCQGHNTVLASCSMLRDFNNHMKQVAEERNSVLSDIEALKLQKAPTYRATVVKFAIRMRYLYIIPGLQYAFGRYVVTLCLLPTAINQL